MSKPPKGTVIFQSIPTDTQHWLVGIDTKFFSINQLLRGIKLIPNGIHLIHYSLPTTNSSSPETALETSIRYGHWIQFDNEVIVLNWNSDSERFEIIDSQNEAESLNYSKYTADLGSIYPYTIAYPENESQWSQLVLFVDMEVIQEFVSYSNEHFSEEINTVTPSKEENMILLEQLQKGELQRQHEQQIPPGSLLETAESELKYTIIQFMAKRDRKDEPTSVEEISNDYLDKSWYLEQLYGNDPELLLGELQVCFILFIILGNFCSGLHWLNIIKLVLMSKSFMNSTKSFTLNFLTVLEKQLQALPEEYVGEKISLNSAVDTKSFISIMENFVRDVFPKDSWDSNSCCGKMKINGLIIEKWQLIVNTINAKFNIDLTKLENPEFDEDQFEVFHLKDYDENDEDTPTLV